ncbi:MAG: hypothetical protein JWR18_2152 [Segetibacter sp.]|jgi:hypothetical protein|nr:hypothetical protein [Segetibacter sp.]
MLNAFGHANAWTAIQTCSANISFSNSTNGTFFTNSRNSGKHPWRFAYSLLRIFLLKTAMLKFLLTILLISSGTRIVTGNGLSMLNYGLDKLWVQEEEDGKEKPEKKQTKQTDDDFPVYYQVHCRATPSGGDDTIPLRHHEPYYGFFDQPNTPPPDWSNLCI